MPDLPSCVWGCVEVFRMTPTPYSYSFIRLSELRSTSLCQTLLPRRQLRQIYRSVPMQIGTNAPLSGASSWARMMLGIAGRVSGFRRGPIPDCWFSCTGLTPDISLTFIEDTDRSAPLTGRSDTSLTFIEGAEWSALQYW